MKDAAREADRWLRQAQHDLEFGRVALKEGYFGQACFIAQQSAEKALKSVAYGLGERVVLGHSLVELVHRLEERVGELGNLASEAGVLDQYYVATRYPNGLPGGVPFEAFGEDQARSAISDAEKFVALAETRLEE